MSVPDDNSSDVSDVGQSRLFEMADVVAPDQSRAASTPSRVVVPADAVIVRVLIDEAAIDREFDYWVPSQSAQDIRVGSIVRVDLRGRRVRGWVVERDVASTDEFETRKISKVSGLGPPPAIIELARWAAARWVGRTSRFLRTASPPINVVEIPRRSRQSSSGTVIEARISTAFEHPVSIVRVGPSADETPFAMAAVARGRSLLLVPTLSAARHLALRLRRAGVDTALWDRDWAKSASGAVTVGTRAAAFAPIGPLASVVVFDEHDERHQEESSPTWHAREVAIERARRDGAACVLVSPTPSLQAQSAGVLLFSDRKEERASWPAVDVIDRRDEDPRSGEWCSPQLARLVQGDRTVACILNRTGRARLSICNQCGEVARSDAGTALLMDGDEFVVPASGERRPVVCESCGATRFRRVRLGVAGVAEELAKLSRREVAEVTASDGPISDTADLYVGTEALLHRLEQVDTVVFLDLDQELLAPRFMAAEQAMALIAAAARLVGKRADGGRIALQTRLPEHHVVRAALHADPALVSSVELDRRRELSLPPFSAMAVVSGAVAPAFMAAFDPVGEVEVVGQDDGKWLLRAADHETLTAALRTTPRPAGRMRIEVDPTRV